MIRGNERKKLFFDDEDRARFINILYDKSKDNRYIIYAYCLMDNHVHLLINEGSESISTIMKRINVSYAYYFNRKYGRIGHLFQDRFKSEAVEDDAYLLAAIRYIHNNPVKASIVNDAINYRWSSYHLYIKGNQNLGTIDTDYILEIFSKDKAKAIRQFIEFTSKSNDDRFIEYIEEDYTGKSIFNEKDAKVFILSYLNESKITLEDLKDKSNIKLRNKLILYLKNNSTLSIRQIADNLALNRNIIQRTK